MKHIFLLAIVSVVTLTGCATRLTGGVDVLNQRIAYLGLNDKECWNPDNPADAELCKLKVRAGMKIRLDSIAIPSESKSVEQQTLPSSYTYTVPNVDGTLADGLALGRGNAFFMTTLLSMSEQVIRKKDSKEGAWQLMYGDGDDSYKKRVATASTYADNILKPFLKEMSVLYNFLEKKEVNTQSTAQHAKRVFCSAEMSDLDLDTDLVSRALRVQLTPKENGPAIELGSDNWFYSERVRKIDEDRLSEFMNPITKATRARTNIELSIAVRFSSEEGVRYVLPCTTIADIEQIFGIEIDAIWREQSNLAVKGNEGDATAGGLITTGWSNKSTVSPDGYYSIELRPGATAAPGGILVDGSELCGKKNPCLERVLLAHGDILLVGRRKHVLGSFWHQ